MRRNFKILILIACFMHALAVENAEITDKKMSNGSKSLKLNENSLLGTDLKSKDKNINKRQSIPGENNMTFNLWESPDQQDSGRNNFNVNESEYKVIDKKQEEINWENRPLYNSNGDRPNNSDMTQSVPMFRAQANANAQAQAQVNTQVQGNAQSWSNGQMFGNNQMWGNQMPGSNQMWGNQMPGNNQMWGNQMPGNNQMWGNQMPRNNQMWGNNQMSGNNQMWGNNQMSGNNQMWGNNQMSGNNQMWGNNQMFGNAQAQASSKAQSQAAMNWESRKNIFEDSQAQIQYNRNMQSGNQFSNVRDMDYGRRGTSAVTEHRQVKQIDDCSPIANQVGSSMYSSYSELPSMGYNKMESDCTSPCGKGLIINFNAECSKSIPNTRCAVEPKSYYSVPYISSTHVGSPHIGSPYYYGI